MPNTITNLETSVRLQLKDRLNPSRFPSIISTLNMNCNIYLITLKKLKGGKIITEYYLNREDEDEFNKINEQESTQYTKQIISSCQKLCNGIPKSFIDTSITNSDMVIYQFSKEEIISRSSSRSINRVSSKPSSSASSRATTKISRLSSAPIRSSRSLPRSILNSSRTKSMKAPKKFKFSLCGFACLKNLDDLTIGFKVYNNIYLDLICSQPGLGSNLLKIIEETSKKLGKNRLYLKSIYNPLPFYLYKEFKFNEGTNIADLKAWYDENIKSGKEIEFRSDPFCQLTNRIGRQSQTTKSGRKSSVKKITKIKDCNYLMSIEGGLENGITMYKDL
jgi:hypothetical protein